MQTTRGRRPAAPSWPGGARFAFTIFDDTDMTTLVNGPPVYDVLTDLGFRITKSVWPVAPSGPPRTGGATCADRDYLAWVQRLQASGHEIGYHNASDHPSTRESTVAALDAFRDMFGADPRIGADHSGNLEAMYWGPRRLTGARSWLFDHASALARPERPEAPGPAANPRHFQGEVPTSPYFWGDVLRDRIDYWRNFTFTDVNVLNPCPQLPYHDPARPYVNWWFAATQAPTLVPLLDLLDPARLDRLEAEGGACIAYTHLGVDTAPDGRLDPRFAPAMERLAARPGWFTTASSLLDHLRERRGVDVPLDDAARRRMERRWLGDQLRARTGSEARKAIARRRR
ncbi:hypothetical protein KSP35_01180 [Aquihabitans sp. G128]|uniref:hypothetical protein n=1 Tax=Aquihabitans sp. G128 TaxID=2849779 RepID=UPI001C245F40|nr:hypothetical protein [Aquihabitans sp. G128]QXC61492.1 hypothetical protein KSP35_01180 [Aquihabitans sp. G128]